MRARERNRGLGRMGVLGLWVLAVAAVPLQAPGQVPGQAQPRGPAPVPAAVTPPQATAQAPAQTPAQTPDQVQATCLKNVFGLYCLGTDVNSLLRQRPPTDQARDGERLALIYDQGQEQDYVLAFRGTIYKVVRQFRVETQLKFDDIYNQLREKYGAGDDRSLFPGYADNPASRQGSIRRGDGKAIHVWAPADSWRIELTWTREFGLSLAYVDNDLDAEQRAAVQRGL